MTGYDWGLEAEARRLGMAAFLKKETASDQLVEIIVKLFPTHASRAGPRGDLTAREREVARLAAGGMTNTEIAQALCISENTVKIHVSHILDKLRLSHRIDFARSWKGYTPLDSSRTEHRENHPIG